MYMSVSIRHLYCVKLWRGHWKPEDNQYHHDLERNAPTRVKGIYMVVQRSYQGDDSTGDPSTRVFVVTGQQSADTSPEAAEIARFTSGYTQRRRSSHI